uniref:Uncharacterized protein n=1 Tax=Anguilla anguilla TaxID=7936 RepID=A0A0E9RP81_ANGAN
MLIYMSLDVMEPACGLYRGISYYSS